MIERKVTISLFLLMFTGMLDAQRFALTPRYDRNGVPDWKIDQEFGHDVFTFVRVRYSSWNRNQGKWSTDYPDSDLSFSYRLQQLTSMQVDPNGKILELTDKNFSTTPFFI